MKMTNHCLVIGLDDSVNKEDKNKPFYYMPENGQYLVVANIYWVLANREEFIAACECAVEEWKRNES